MIVINQTDGALSANFAHNIVGAANIIGADRVEVNDHLVWFHFGEAGQLGYRTAAMTVGECHGAKNPAELTGLMFRQNLDRIHALCNKKKD